MTGNLPKQEVFVFKRNIFIAAIWSLVLVFSVLPSFAQSVDTAWVRRYNGSGDSTDAALAIAVDDYGNVYVTGKSYSSATDFDYTTIKYYSNGDTAWLRRYNGPANLWDEAGAIGVDGSGNVCVTGSSRGIGPGNDYADLVTIKYDSSGNESWVSRYNGPSVVLPDGGMALVIDSVNNIYVTGYSYSFGTSYDFLTVKYYPNGDTTWLRTYDGPGQHDIAYDIAVDGSGSVYVTGYSNGGATSWEHSDYATVKYDPNGNELWAREYSGPGDSLDWPRAIAADNFGNVYVTGNSIGSGTLQDYATIKYDSNGNELWVRRYDGPANSEDNANDIAIDISGDVYVTGASTGSGTGRDYTTIKYYPNGDTAWVRRYNSPYIQNGYDEGVAIKVDSHGYVFVSGTSAGFSGAYDYVTIKYDGSGNELWVGRYSSVDNSWAKDMAIDSSGNVYVTGESWGSGSNYDYTTIKYVQFLCGDVNNDGVVNVGDAIYILNYLFKHGPVPVPSMCVGDVNNDELVNIGDAIYILNYLFKGGPPPDCP